MDDHVQIARLPTPRSALALAGQPQTRTGFHPGGNLEGWRDGLDAALAPAFAAGLADGLTRPAAGRTGLPHLEKTAAADHHAGTAAAPAHIRLGPGFPAAALAHSAFVHHGQGHLALGPEDRLLEINFEIHPQIRAAADPSRERPPRRGRKSSKMPPPPPPPPPPMAPMKVRNASSRSMPPKPPPKPPGPPPPPPPPPPERGVAELVVALAFVGLAQDTS
jgi:hypothetical protein